MKFKCILVPVSGAKVDEETVRFACDLARRNKAKVYVAYVIEIDRTLPIDAEIESEIRKGEEILNRAEDIAEKAGWEVETDLLQAREGGPALIEEAVECGADLIIIGAVYQTKFGEFSLGETIPYVLKHTPCRVMLWWEPLKEEVAE